MRVSAEDGNRPAYEYAENEINDGADAAIDRGTEVKVRSRQPGLPNVNTQGGIPIVKTARAKTAEPVKDTSADNEPNTE